MHECQADTAAKELSNHIQSLWDQYFITELDEYTFNGDNVDIAGLLLLPHPWRSRWSFLISGVSQVSNFFQQYTNPLDKNFLTNFFEDKARSGKYHVDGTVYAHAALECLRNMVNPNDE